MCCLNCRTFPIRGFQIYDGPVRLTQSTFRGFIPTPERYTSAVGFNLKNTWQLTPRNNLSQLSFHSDVSQRPHFWFIFIFTLCPWLTLCVHPRVTPPCSLIWPFKSISPDQCPRLGSYPVSSVADLWWTSCESLVPPCGSIEQCTAFKQHLASQFAIHVFMYLQYIKSDVWNHSILNTQCSKKFLRNLYEISGMEFISVSQEDNDNHNGNIWEQISTLCWWHIIRLNN